MRTVCKIRSNHLWRKQYRPDTQFSFNSYIRLLVICYANAILWNISPRILLISLLRGGCGAMWPCVVCGFFLSHSFCDMSSAPAVLHSLAQECLCLPAFRVFIFVEILPSSKDEADSSNRNRTRRGREWNVRILTPLRAVQTKKKNRKKYFEFRVVSHSTRFDGNETTKRKSWPKNGPRMGPATWRRLGVKTDFYAMVTWAREKYCNNVFVKDWRLRQIEIFK